MGKIDTIHPINYPADDAIPVQQNPILYRHPRSSRQVQTPEGTDVEDGDVADEEDLGDYERP